MAQVTLRKIVKKYDEVLAVRGIDLDIVDKEFIVLVGPSGCGKSTTLRMIAGLEEISGGDIAIGGHVVNDVPPKDRDIAMVFQNYALYPHMNVYENMSFGLKLKKTPKDEIDKRVKQAAQILDITELLERKPKQLSGGQRQRVAMGRAIVRDPKVFLFDEPLSNLDAKLRVQMRVEISRLHQRLGNTVVYVTHDQTEAMTMADRIVIMNVGRIEQVGAPLEVYDRPANVFVAQFIGSPAMNFLDGRFEAAGGAPRIVGSGFELSLDAATPRIDAGRPLRIGIRPEDFTIGGTDCGLQGRVTLTEPLGREILIYAEIGSTEICMSINGRDEPAPGAELPLGVLPGKTHLFDAASGARVA